jgi:hypothetical protein
MSQTAASSAPWSPSAHLAEGDPLATLGVPLLRCERPSPDVRRTTVTACFDTALRAYSA